MLQYLFCHSHQSIVQKQGRYRYLPSGLKTVGNRLRKIVLRGVRLECAVGVCSWGRMFGVGSWGSKVQPTTSWRPMTSRNCLVGTLFIGSQHLDEFWSQWTISVYLTGISSFPRLHCAPSVFHTYVLHNLWTFTEHFVAIEKMDNSFPKQVMLQPFFIH